MSIDLDIQRIKDRIAELTDRQKRFAGTDRYNQIGAYIDDLLYELAMLEVEKKSACNMEQDEWDDSSFYQQ